MANLSPGTAQLGARSLTIAAITIPDSRQGVWVEYLSFTNSQASDYTVTVKDGNGRYFVAGSTIPGTGATSGAGEPRDYNLPDGGVFFAGGIVVTSNADNKIDMWIRYRNA